MSKRSKRALSLTACYAAVAVTVFVGFRYGLPRIGLSEQPPIRLGSIERPGKADRAALAILPPGVSTARPMVSPEPPVDALATLHAMAEAGTTRLPAAAISAHRSYLASLATEAPAAPKAAERTSGGQKPSPASGDTLSLLPILPPVAGDGTQPPRLKTDGAPGHEAETQALPGPAGNAPDITGSIGRSASGDGTGLVSSLGDLPDGLGLTETRTFPAIEVLDGRSFRANGLTVRLAGITLPRANRLCQKIDGTTEPCLERARTRLDLITRHRLVRCDLETTDPGKPASGRCKVGSMDLSVWMTREGWVLPTAEDAAFAPALAEAKRIRAGIWR